MFSMFKGPLTFLFPFTFRVCDVGTRAFLLGFLAFFLFIKPLFSMSLDWSGTYRMELFAVNDVEIHSEKWKSYFLHYLQLSPVVVVNDFVRIHSRLDVINSEDTAGSQRGAFIGSSPGNAFGADGIGSGSSTGWAKGGAAGFQKVEGEGTEKKVAHVFSQNSGGHLLRVSQMYLTFQGEFSAFHVGQMPLHFGLGTYHNGGKGVFSHWQDTRQLIAYEMHWSENWLFIPMIGRSARAFDEDGSGASHEIKDMILQLLYSNKSTGSRIGFMHDRRRASVHANDAPYPGDLNASQNQEEEEESGSESITGGTGESVLTGLPLRAQRRSAGFSSEATTIYFSRSFFEDWRFQFEGTFLTGETGLFLENGHEISLSSYGIVTELLYREGETLQRGSSGKLKLGLATGDDPSTDAYEAFSFDPNYNVGLLLFNHPLGAYDLLQSSLYRRNGKRRHGARVSVDEERIGNVFYLAPEFSHKASEKSFLTYRFVYANLQKSDFLNEQGEIFETGKDLGMELNLEWHYKFQEKAQFLGQVALLFPGKAFEYEGSVSSLVYAFQAGLSLGF